jgi:hypothetical protein
MLFVVSEYNLPRSLRLTKDDLNMRHLNILKVVGKTLAFIVLLTPLSALAAGPVFWDWPADRSFGDMDFSGAAVNQDGQLVAGLTSVPIGPTGPEIFWRVVADGEGGFYTGTGHGGEVYHTTAAGKSSLLASLDCTEIFSLLPLPDGDLLVGSGPEGVLYRVQPSGENESLGTVEGGYIWHMSWDAEGKTVWMATGSPAGLWRFDLSSDEMVQVLELPAQNALAVHVLDGGAVLVSTQGPGLVYNYSGGDEAELVFETEQDEARQFIEGPENTIFLLALESGAQDVPNLMNPASGQSTNVPPSLMPLLVANQADAVEPAALYQLTEAGQMIPYWSGSIPVLTVAWSERWGWLAGGAMEPNADESVLRRLSPPSGAHEIARWAGGDVLDILVPDNSEDNLVIGQAHPGAVVGLGAHKNSPRYALSQVLDGKGPVKWGRLSWRGTGQDGSPMWSVRTGNKEEPDESWSQWSKPWTEEDHALAVSQSRYLQWRVDLPISEPGVPGWRVTDVSLSAWQDNQAPVISDFQLEYLKDMNLGGMIHGADNVTQRFRSGLQAEFSYTAKPDNWAGPARGAMSRAMRIFTWVATDANGDRIGYTLEYRLIGEGDWRSVSSRRPGIYETAETLVGWDTAEVIDGRYELRLTASDRHDNPAPLALSSERILGPILVDNTAPEIDGFSVEKTETGFRVSCRAADESTILAGARIVLPDGTTERFDPTDQICDSQKEEFKTDVTWPRPGEESGGEPWQVRVELRDLGGNVAVATEVVR